MAEKLTHENAEASISQGVIVSMFHGVILDNQLKNKTLKSILSSIENPEKHALKLKRKSLLLTGISWFALMIVFFLHFQGFTGLYLLAISAFSGIAYGFVIYLDSARKQWQFIIPHIDIEAVKEEVLSDET
ncbi:hypothetical protein J8L84_20005 [Alteromonas sp. MMG017]|uniref:hypothetical protein n=1 Tax=Alteromonas sp. MMG017 TaxID=2822692 RepID=UPI001B39FAA5|nr:hypothetical protein [Alteromonas sp. MMG017]MBQ4831566.1 hypothetical protein [Alteromonas sp. MMG017]